MRSRRGVVSVARAASVSVRRAARIRLWERVSSLPARFLTRDRSGDAVRTIRTHGALQQKLRGAPYVQIRHFLSAAGATMGPTLDGNDGRRPSTALSGQRVHTLTPYGGRGVVILSRCHVYAAPWGVFGGCMHRVCTLACRWVAAPRNLDSERRRNVPCATGHGSKGSLRVEDDHPPPSSLHIDTQAHMLAREDRPGTKAHHNSEPKRCARVQRRPQTPQGRGLWLGTQWCALGSPRGSPPLLIPRDPS
eukprot:2811376-Prymnesium_polylepis.1